MSIDPRATNMWCQSNCAHDEAWCFSTGFCVCDDSFHTESGEPAIASGFSASEGNPEDFDDFVEESDAFSLKLALSLFVVLLSL